MLKIGLTGAIGSGKTTVASIFNVLGVPVFLADKEAKWLMENDPFLIAGIQDLLGKESYNGGKLDRKYIAEIVFTEPFKLERLNALVHPATIAHAAKWMAQQQSFYIIKEAALLFEAGSAGELDYIIGVQAPQALRIKRVLQRDKVDRKKVLERQKHQIPESLKMKLCDFVLVNDEQTLLVPQVIQLHQDLIAISTGNFKY